MTNDQLYEKCHSLEDKLIESDFKIMELKDALQDIQSICSKCTMGVIEGYCDNCNILKTTNKYIDK